jgi:hypothetical protein
MSKGSKKQNLKKTKVLYVNLEDNIAGAEKSLLPARAEVLSLKGCVNWVLKLMKYPRPQGS